MLTRVCACRELMCVCACAQMLRVCSRAAPTCSRASSADGAPVYRRPHTRALVPAALTARLFSVRIPRSCTHSPVLRYICKVSLSCSALYTKCPYSVVLYMQSVLMHYFMQSVLTLPLPLTLTRAHAGRVRGAPEAGTLRLPDLHLGHHRPASPPPH